MMLSGEWDFAYYEKLSLVPDSLDTDSVSFDKITVPCTWQRTGYDQIAYINTRYPFLKNRRIFRPMLQPVFTEKQLRLKMQISAEQSRF